ncbi:MAG: hypothetical protein AABX32_07215, partial [Nanoarchaeota archaeon]
IRWKGFEEKALLVWLISDTPEHRDFLKRELKDEGDSIGTIYASKRVIINNPASKFNKAPITDSYDRQMKKFNELEIKPDVI